MARQQSEDRAIVPIKIKQGRATFYILGLTPLIYNAASEKTKHELLWPHKKTMAERSVSLKHNPPQEYRDSVYRRPDGENGPTRLLAPSRWFKAAIAQVAKRVPGGGTTAELKQLVWVEGEYCDLYGTPEVYMAMVISAGMNRTPDIRTRALVPRWCCKLVINHVLPQVQSEAVATLLMNAGILNGVGDFRQQKGAGSYGQFELVNESDPRYKALVKNEGLKVQDRYLKELVPHDEDTSRMLATFNEKMRKRDKDSGEHTTA